MKTNRNVIQIVLLSSFLTAAFTSQAQLTITKIAAGGGHTLFLRSDGSLWAMGSDYSGQLGDDFFSNRIIPEQIVMSGVTAIAAGGGQSLFLKNDGSLWAMGWNQYGQLGDGTTNDSNVPELIVSSNVTAIAAGNEHSLFLKSDGSLWAMGGNQYGQLGDETTNNNPVPEEIVSSGVTAIAAGGGHSLFIKKTGEKTSLTIELWGMGNETYGELGNGIGCDANPQNLGYFDPFYTNVPVLIERATTGIHPLGLPVTAIAAGADHSLFIKSDGSLWTMGDDDGGQLGDGVIYRGPDGDIGTNRPEQIVASGVTAIAAGNYHSLFIKSDGSLSEMGDNSYGELGDGTTDGGNYEVNLPEQIEPAGVAAISAGGQHSLFIKTDGNLWAMGDDEFGQLGDGMLYDEFSPELITIVSPPLLGITIYGSQPLLIFTNANSTNFSLQMSTNLASGNWVTVTNAIPVNAVQIPNVPSNAFFRLH